MFLSLAAQIATLLCFCCSVLCLCLETLGGGQSILPWPELSMPAATGSSRWWFPCSISPLHGEAFPLALQLQCLHPGTSVFLYLLPQFLSTRPLMHMAGHGAAFRCKQIWIKVQPTSLELMSLSFSMEEVKHRGEQLLC